MVAKIKIPKVGLNCPALGNVFLQISIKSVKIVMDKKKFIAIAFKDHFDDATIECQSNKGVFIEKLESIYEKRKNKVN